MVATDVASRGIGMMKLQSPHPSPVLPLVPSPVLTLCDNGTMLDSL
jgi:hypothetical protein